MFGLSSSLPLVAVALAAFVFGLSSVLGCPTACCWCSNTSRVLVLFRLVFAFIIETWVRMIGTCVPVKEAAFLGQLAVRFNFLWQLKWTTARFRKLYCLSFFSGRL